MHPESLKISWGALVLLWLLQEEAVGSAKERRAAGTTHIFRGHCHPRVTLCAKCGQKWGECQGCVWQRACVGVCSCEWNRDPGMLRQLERRCCEHARGGNGEQGADL